MKKVLAIAVMLFVAVSASQASVLNSWLVLSETPYTYTPITESNFWVNDSAGWAPFYVQLWVSVSSDPNLRSLNGQPESLESRGLSDIAWSVNAVNTQYPTCVKYKSITWLLGNESITAPTGVGRVAMWANSVGSEVQYGMFGQGGSTAGPQVNTPQSIVQAADGFAGSAPLDPAPNPWPDQNMDMGIGTPGSGVGTVTSPQSPVGQINSATVATRGGSTTITSDGLGTGTGAVELSYETWQLNDALVGGYDFNGQIALTQFQLSLGSPTALPRHWAVNDPNASNNREDFSSFTTDGTTYSGSGQPTGTALMTGNVPVVTVSAPTWYNTVHGTQTTPPLTLNVFQAGGDLGITAVNVNYGDNTSSSSTALPYTTTHTYTIPAGTSTPQNFTLAAAATNGAGTGQQASQTVQVLQSPSPVLYLNGQQVTPGSTVRILGHTALNFTGLYSTGYVEDYQYLNNGTILQDGATPTYTIADAFSIHNEPMSFLVYNSGLGDNGSAFPMSFTVTSPVPVFTLTVPATKVNTVNGTLSTPTLGIGVSQNSDPLTSGTVAVNDGWSAGLTGVTTTTNFNHVFTITNSQTSQSFNVTANGANDGGAAQQALQSILVVQSPTAGLTIDGQTVTQGATIKIPGNSPAVFVDASTGYIENWSYSLADGNHTTENYTAATGSSVFGAGSFTVSNTGVGNNSYTLNFTLASAAQAPTITVSAPAIVNIRNGATYAVPLTVTETSGDPATARRLIPATAAACSPAPV